MRVGLVTNLQSRGLAMDARLLEGLLTSLGHEVVLVQYDKFYDEPADLLIYCEVVVPRFLSLSKAAPWLFVNPEFLFERDFKTIRSQFGKILCKTHEAHRICSQHFGIKAVYTGFISADKFDPAIPRERKFLHVAGSSKIKGTQSAIDAWRWSRQGQKLDAQLTVVADWLGSENMPENVTVLKNISDEELTVLQNSHLFHLQPSGTEGFGHALRESMSVNAVLLTTDAPPMNEINCPFLLSTEDEASNCREATVYEVSAIDIHFTARHVLAMREHGGNPRDEFLRGNEEFKQRFSDLLDTLKPAEHRPPVKFDRDFPDQLRVAFLGNFAHSFCTESDLAWSFEHMGHEVIRVQENTATISELQGAVLDADMFLWVHTHGWDSISHEDMLKFLDLLRSRKIPSVFFHLDRYFGIPEREERIGLDPCWKCDCVFTADGGNDEKFWARGVNHFWSPPAVVERAIHYGFPRGDLRCDVAFVGAGAGYHDCWPFRADLLCFLQSRYGAHFKHFQGVRESELNDVYASAKVVVGDNIFAGAPRYASDRLPETCGRGGFLLYPSYEGKTIPCPTYNPQDLENLGDLIDGWLSVPVSRREIVKVCMEHVRENDTYGHRISSILKTVFPGRV